MKNQNNLYMVLFFISLSGCTSKQNLEIWIVEKEMPLYETYIGDSQKTIAILQEGDICVPGITKGAKVFQYIEVLCLEKGYGWVADNYFHKINGRNQGVDLNL